MMDFLSGAEYQGGAGCWNSEDDYSNYAEGSQRGRRRRRYVQFYWPTRKKTKAEKSAWLYEHRNERAAAAFEDVPFEEEA